LDSLTKDVTLMEPSLSSQATDKAVSHPAYACQDAATYAGCNPGVNSVDTSSGPHFVLGTLGVVDFSER